MANVSGHQSLAFSDAQDDGFDGPFQADVLASVRQTTTLSAAMPPSSCGAVTPGNRKADFSVQALLRADIVAATVEPVGVLTDELITMMDRTELLHVVVE